MTDKTGDDLSKASAKVAELLAAADELLDSTDQYCASKDDVQAGIMLWASDKRLRAAIRAMSGES